MYLESQVVSAKIKTGSVWPSFCLNVSEKPECEVVFVMLHGKWGKNPVRVVFAFGFCLVLFVAVTVWKCSAHERCTEPLHRGKDSNANSCIRVNTPYAHFSGKKSKKHNIQIILKNLPYLTKRPQIVLHFVKHKLIMFWKWNIRFYLELNLEEDCWQLILIDFNKETNTFIFTVW